MNFLTPLYGVPFCPNGQKPRPRTCELARLRAQFAQESGLCSFSVRCRKTECSDRTFRCQSSPQRFVKKLPCPRSPRHNSSCHLFSSGNENSTRRLRTREAPHAIFCAAGRTAPQTSRLSASAGAIPQRKTGAKEWSGRRKERRIAAVDGCARVSLLSCADLPCLLTYVAGQSGAEGTRTLDPRLAKPMLSQLSYGPRERTAGPRKIRKDLSARWTSCRQWAHEDSNFGPRRYQRRALTN